MIPENPAVRLYSYWRTIMEYQGRRHIYDARERLETFATSLRTKNLPWESARSDIESYSLSAHQSNGYAPQVMMDYRMGLRVVGMSDRHVAEENRLWNDLSDWLPVIQLAVRIRYSRSYNVMTLWPNGDFRIEIPPHEGMHQIYPQWTFFRTSWAASSRAWLPEQADEPHTARGGWVSIDVKDFHKGVPYVGRRAFRRGAHYRLAWDGKFWRFISQYGFDDGNYDFNTDADAKNVLRAEYDRCERRYERYRRLSISSTSESRTRKVAIYVPNHGRMTGLEAIQQFKQHMRVYEGPTKATKEATDGTDGLVASAVHQ